MSGSLFIHIAAGFCALFAGTLVHFLKKGTRLHQKVGLVFYYAMLMTGTSALWLSTLRKSEFLFCIGIFAIYQTVSGRRAVVNKGLRPSWWEYALSLVALLNGIYMIATTNIVLMVFGALCTALAVQDGWLYLKMKNGREVEKNAWLKKHIGMMMGSYISTFTAFLVVNINDFEPGWLLWLLPTFVFVPVMAMYQRKYAKDTPQGYDQSL